MDRLADVKRRIQDNTTFVDHRGRFVPEYLVQELAGIAEDIELARRSYRDSSTYINLRMDNLKQAAEKFNSIIDGIELRCMAADGPVTPTLQEMNEKELLELWKAVQVIRKALNG